MRLADQVEVHSSTAGIVFLFRYAVAVSRSLPVSMFCRLPRDCCSDNGSERPIASRSAQRFFNHRENRHPLRARAGPWLHRLEAGFRQNAVSYLLVLRMIVIFPFGIVNLVPVFLGM
jgi:hypothetical protein